MMETGDGEPTSSELMTTPHAVTTGDDKAQAHRPAPRGWKRIGHASAGIFFLVFGGGTAALSIALGIAFSLVAFGRIEALFVLGWLCVAVITSASSSLVATLIHERLWERQRSLEHLATVDELTGAPNRRVFEARLASEVDRCSRQESALSLVFIDIDFFKTINDEYGHLVGDRVLKEIFARLEDNLRLYDFVGRLGGDEFVMALPGTDEPAAFGVAERLRESVQRSPAATLPAVTVSLGVAQLGPGMSAEQLIKNADIALYRAKNSGRNRTEVFRATGHSVS
jgi:diguanylate cyclase (GGDEF)-like protein